MIFPGCRRGVSFGLNIVMPDCNLEQTCGSCHTFGHKVRQIGNEAAASLYCGAAAAAFGVTRQRRPESR